MSYNLEYHWSDGKVEEVDIPNETELVKSLKIAAKTKEHPTTKAKLEYVKADRLDTVALLSGDILGMLFG